MKLVLAFVIGIAAVCLLPGAANAQATRTWVSGVGDDANPCSRTAPCKTFAGAISKTSAAGEINCLDPGGFGAVTITKAISIICIGVEGGVLVSGTPGITISAGATDTVVLDGLDFEGIGSGTIGINIISAGTVHVRNTLVRGFTTGINMTGSVAMFVDLANSTVMDNTGEGIFCKPTGVPVRIMMDHVIMSHNSGDGFIANGNGGGTIKASIRASESVDNGAAGFAALSSTSVAQLMIDASSAVNNNTSGIGASGAGAIIRFTRSSVTANTTGVSQDTGGMALSYGTNSVDGNGSDGVFTTIPQK
jgi:hypothetical protein